MKGKGFRRIDTQYFEALMSADLTRSGYKVVLAVIHKTWGWQQESSPISLTEFTKLTGLSRRGVIDAIRQLEAQGVVKVADTRPHTYSIMAFAEWNTSEVGLPSAGEVGFTSEMSKTSPSNVENFTKTSEVPMPATPPIKEKRNSLKKVCDASITTGTTNKYNNSQGDIPLNPPSKTIRKLSSNPYIAQLQEYLGFPGKTAVDPVPSPGREAKTIKRMLDRGFTWDEILACWKGKVSQRGGDFVSMVWVNEDIGKKAGSGAHRQSPRQLKKREDYTESDDYPT